MGYYTGAVDGDVGKLPGECYLYRLGVDPGLHGGGGGRRLRYHPDRDLELPNNTNAGTATATATYAGDANHAGSSGSTTFIIAPVTPLVTVSCAPGSFVYTGSALTPARLP